MAGDVAVLAVGFLAGTVNTVVGAGSLLTFPTLLALGYPSVVANVSNTVGLVFGAASGAVGYRAELRGQAGTLRALVPLSLVGGVLGGVLLLVLPGGVFDGVVPALVLLSVLLVGGQPRLSAALARRGAGRGRVGLPLQAGVLACGTYGGYFGAAQGVLLLGLLGLLLPIRLQQANAVKNVLAAVVNGVAALYFVFAAHVAWQPALLLAVSSSLGGVVGARYGRRLPPRALRIAVVVVGTGVAVALTVRTAT